MSADRKFGEAVAELRRRLDALGIESAAAVAQDFMHDLVQQGWRCVGRPIERHSLPAPEHLATDEQRHAYAEQCRREMAVNKFRPKEETE